MNQTLGIFLNITGSFAAASFYLSFRRVRNWSWESYWFICSLFTWFIGPWIIAYLTVPDLMTILREAPARSISWTFIFGLIWGIGGLTWGLSLRYLGISLGIALVLGLTTVFGMLVPPIFTGKFMGMIMSTSGQVTIAGLLVCLTGIFFTGWAGVSKENEQSREAKQKYIRDFSFKKGIMVALLSGLTCAFFAFAIETSKPIADVAVQYGTTELWKNNAGLIFIMNGCFITNAVACIFLSIKNKSLGDYINSGDASISVNYLFASIAGIIAYMEYLLYGMGITKMGENDYVSFSIHLAFVIIFSTMLGWLAYEWKGSSRRTVTLIFTGILVLIFSSVVMGYGNYLSFFE